ncbi:hypothetical protein GPALN_003521 [Globodera pallida]|uniref:MSP domain-containing protein n=1 Tax=Globodera pallida TaxID=36090 RepID=A0A183BKG9_GLOPA|nr:hypothetical protein GPALN_003521 [Globodera pallida]
MVSIQIVAPSLYLLQLDNIPCSLGIDSADGVMTSIIKRHTTLPFATSQTIRTTFENQREVLFKVYVGERARTDDNNLLAEFKLNDIRPAPSGAQFQVTFHINNLIMHVSAMDKTTRNPCTVTVVNDEARLSKPAIVKMVRDAEQYSQQDKRLRRIADLTRKRNAVDREIMLLKGEVKEFDDAQPERDVLVDVEEIGLQGVWVLDEEDTGTSGVDDGDAGTSSGR